MGQAVKVKIAEVSRNEYSKIGLLTKLVDVRVSPNSYFGVFFVSGFLTGFLIYLDWNWTGLAFLGSSLTLIALLAWKDRIVFDGRQIYRTGIVPKFWGRLNRRRRRLKVSQIEQIETQALRALKRGGNVFYRYRTTIYGRGLRFTFASGGADYRRMVGHLFPKVSDDVLDIRSVELRSYLRDSKETLMKAEFARIPSMEVLESSVNKFQKTDRRLRRITLRNSPNVKDSEKANYLHKLANELRMSGYLLQGLEAFRRVLLIEPDNAWVLFEFARCLHSYGSSERDPELIKKARAVLRLAEVKAGNDTELLSRIGETYAQYGNWKRAEKIFHRTLSESENCFRSVRGLAEVALREGKIAHVIHHFGAATYSTGDRALRRWADGENDYFTRLNNDEDYLRAEMTRISWLDSIERKKRVMLRFSLFSLLIVFLGLLVGDTIVRIGWTASFISILLWSALVVSQRFLAERCRIPKPN